VGPARGGDTVNISRIARRKDPSVRRDKFNLDTLSLKNDLRGAMQLVLKTLVPAVKIAADVAL
jgi:hypothetical protein